jgi:hypothetical protein
MQCVGVWLSGTCKQKDCFRLVTFYYMWLLPCFSIGGGGENSIFDVVANTALDLF